MKLHYLTFATLISLVFLTGCKSMFYDDSQMMSNYDSSHYASPPAYGTNGGSSSSGSGLEEPFDRGHNSESSSSSSVKSTFGSTDQPQN